MQILKPLARFLAGLGATPFALALALPSVAHADGQVNIYSYREPQLVAPMLKAFTEATGIKTNLIFAKDGLVERIAAEGRNSPADVILANGLASWFRRKRGRDSEFEGRRPRGCNPSLVAGPRGPLVRAHRAAPASFTPPRSASRPLRSPMRTLPTPSGRARSARVPASTPTTSRLSLR